MDAIDSAILATVAYADIFDYPLTAAEIHRYLIGLALPGRQLHAHLDARIPPQVSRRDGYYMLAGREAIVDVRRRRERRAKALWPAAVRYGRLSARFPFVRMVAVTGSLAVNNVDRGADVDYLIVTADGRLWLCRALIIALVRFAARQGVSLCPNYFLAERALHVADQSLYTARELVQMVPIAGRPAYRALRHCNSWTRRFLPNAQGAPPLTGVVATPPRAGRWQAAAERVLSTSLGGRLEQWERERKIRKLGARAETQGEALFGPDWCKGHFDAHQQRVMAAFAERQAQT